MTSQGFSLSALRDMVMTLLAMLLLWSTPAMAQTHIRAQLAAESLSPKPGSTVMLAIDMQPEAGWHGYWKNPGDAGVGISLDWDLPKGATLGPMRWPVPEKLMVAGLMNHVFNGDHALLLPLTLPKDVTAGTKIPLRAKAQWLACTDKICVPERGELALDLVIGDGEIRSADRARFDGWRAALAMPLGSPARFAREGDQLRIAIPLPATLPLNDPWFFAETENALSYAAPQKIGRVDNLLIIETKATSDMGVSQLRGVIATSKGRGFDVEAQPGSVPALPDSALAKTILLALGGALLGGLLLNIMPCVFPVISLKAMSLARAGGDAQAAKVEALAYAAGVIVTCLALGGALLGLRATGATIGWAFQLQDPRIIFLLLLLVMAIALNLAHVFHLRGFGGGEALAGKDGTSGAFWTGVLAAFVATPCTGPFMAAALGAALVLPTPAALAIFAGLGLGLALPFLLIGFVPALRTRLPKPGPWMARFQSVLSIPMFLTAAALAWLLWRQTGMTGLGYGVVASLLLTLALFWIGRRQAGGKSAALPSLGLVLASLAALPLLPSAMPPASRSVAGEPFSEARLAALRAQGTPVFLYFTADWCLTCKVNEQAAIDRDEVRDAFAKAGIVTMVGDWTNADPAIGRFLEGQGRSGVPYYVFYPKGGGTPQELPQVLTPATLTALAR